MLLVLVIHLVTLWITGVAAQNCDSTLSATGEGQCIPITNCPALQDRFSAREIADFVENYGCGVDSGVSLVCCPLDTAVINSPPSSPGFLPATPSCGANKVNKGGNWPFHVGLGVSSKSLYTAYCNGVLLSPEWVLTEAFCFTEYIIEVALFGLGTADPLQTKAVPIKYTRWYPDFDAYNDVNNIGLARLEHPVQLSDNIQLACLPPTAPSLPPSQHYAVFIAAVDDGTGTQVLEAVSEQKRKINLDECLSKPNLPIPYLDNRHLCTDAVRFCAPTRPFLVQQNQQGSYTLVGLGGLQSKPCSFGTATFTNVAQHRDYINSVMNTQDTQTGIVDVLYQLSNTLSNLPNTTLCGRRTVDGGSEWPFLASLGDVALEVHDHFVTQCTGVLVTEDWILTDAKCIADNTIRLVAAGITAGSGSPTYRPVAETQLPPNYDPTKDHNTVALVRIRPSPPLQFSNHVQPVCRQMAVHYDYKPLLHALSSGYTFTPSGGVQLSSNMQIVSRYPASKCQSSRYVPFSVNDNMDICSTNIRLCGDFISNPPVLLEQEETTRRFTVVGVGGDNENHCHGDSMAFVRVKPHLPWIKSVVFPQGDPEDLLPTLG